MFKSIAMAPPDSILGLAESFKKDPNPAKINLSVGVFCDETGKTPVLASVKEAEKRLLAQESSKSYLPIEGATAFAACVQEMIFTPGHPALAAKCVATTHTPSGTAAVRVAADFIKKNIPGTRIWMSDPTWPNHPQIFTAAGLEMRSFPYFDPRSNCLAFEPMLAALQEVAPGDVVLLHGCCHNPSGIDPTPQQWQAIGDLLQQRHAIPLVDFAYQGFGRGLQEDAQGVLSLVRPEAELLIASSYSKNFGLYNERVGALTVVARDPDAAARVQSQVKSIVRTLYSSPPAHGGAIVTTILSDAALRSQWEQELAQMRSRIQEMRHQFVQTLQSKNVPGDYSFITRQLGMFSFSGLSKDQVERLKKDFAIYIVGNGRINVAGMTPANMDRLCTAIKSVM